MLPCVAFYLDLHNDVAGRLRKLHTSKGDYCIKQRFSIKTTLFKMETSLKGKYLLPLQREQIISFKSNSLRYGTSLLPH